MCSCCPLPGILLKQMVLCLPTDKSVSSLFWYFLWYYLDKTAVSIDVIVQRQSCNSLISMDSTALPLWMLLPTDNIILPSLMVLFTDTSFSIRWYCPFVTVLSSYKVVWLLLMVLSTDSFAYLDGVFQDKIMFQLLTSLSTDKIVLPTMMALSNDDLRAMPIVIVLSTDYIVLPLWIALPNGNTALPVMMVLSVRKIILQLATGMLFSIYQMALSLLETYLCYTWFCLPIK